LTAVWATTASTLSRPATTRHHPPRH